MHTPAIQSVFIVSGSKMNAAENNQPLNFNPTTSRSEDMKSTSKRKSFLTKKSYLLAIAGFAAFFILLIVYLIQISGSKNSTESSTYNHTYPFTKPVRTGSSLTFRIGVITDLDKSSAQKSSWKAYIKRGYLSYNPSNNEVGIRWDPETTQEPQILTNGYNYKGRGMELSELIVFNGKLLTCDDRTGIIFEVVNQSELVPWVVLADADGSSSKGFKAEWATINDEKLYVGSHGKELTLPDGGMGSLQNMYIKVVTPQGQVTHINWVDQYRRLKSALNISWPGYIIHESVVWSDIHKRWFFLPRKCTANAFDPVADEQLGCNRLLSADVNIFDIKVISLKTDPTRGYSSFKFVPTSQDSVIVAIRTVEIGNHTATYVSAFLISGEILVEDAQISDLKYEGIEFI